MSTPVLCGSMCAERLYLLVSAAVTMQWIPSVNTANHLCWSGGKRHVPDPTMSPLSSFVCDTNPRLRYPILLTSTPPPLFLPLMSLYSALDNAAVLSEERTFASDLPPPV